MLRSSILAPPGDYFVDFLFVSNTCEAGSRKVKGRYCNSELFKRQHRALIVMDINKVTMLCRTFTNSLGYVRHAQPMQSEMYFIIYWTFAVLCKVMYNTIYLSVITSSHAVVGFDRNSSFILIYVWIILEMIQRVTMYFVLNSRTIRKAAYNTGIKKHFFFTVIYRD